MKKRILSLILTVALLCSALSIAASAYSFSDVSADKWYYNAVDYASDQGLFFGTSKTKFSPSATMTRGMFVTVLGRLAKADTAGYTTVSYFYDVSTERYYSPYVQWAAAYQIVYGTSTYYFSPNSNVTREQIATFLYRYAKACNFDTTYDTNQLSAYSDYTSISNYAKTAMAWAVTHNVLRGYTDGTLRPKGNATRAEVAQIFYNCREFLTDGVITRAPIQLKEPPEIVPTPTYVAPTSGTKTVSGRSVTYVTLNPANGYTVSVALGNSKLYSTESAASIAKRTNSIVAVNGAFFETGSGGNTLNTIFSTIISNGEILRYDSATQKQPAFVVDSNGNASIEYFNIVEKLTLTRSGEAIVSDLQIGGINRAVGSSDGSIVLYTSRYGSTLSGTIARGIVVNEDGVVTKVYSSSTSNVPIPSSGYLIAWRSYDANAAGRIKFFSNCKVGDTITKTVSYSGSSTQDIVTSLSCGPTLVKNGAVSCTTSTMNAEGYTASDIVSASAQRTAIGVKADGTVVIACASGTMVQMANVMKEMGCQAAISLDGGASSALYMNSGANALVSAGRNMSNMLIFAKS